MNSSRSRITSPRAMGWNVAVGSAAIPNTKGLLLAWDPVHQKEAWRVEYLGPWNGGVLTTAGNLVVQGDAAGNVNVYRADSGEKLWSMSAQSAVMGGPSTYEVNGEQYIAVMAGWGGAFPLIEGKEAARSGNLRNVSRVLVFKVGGTASFRASARAEAGAQPARGDRRCGHRRRRPSGCSRSTAASAMAKTRSAAAWCRICARPISSATISGTRSCSTAR